MSTGKPLATDKITKLTDSTTGTVSNTLDDTTVGTKDDLASLNAKLNEVIDLLNKFGNR